MMRYLKYTIISFIALCFASESFACWGPWYTPSGYFMYRVNEERPEPTIDVEACYPGSGRNCEEWQALTSKSIPLEDIYKVVYTMTLEEIEAICDHKEVVYENSFIEWITKKDVAILDFLLLAKTNEYIRLKRNSRWYYPSMKIGTRMTIEELVDVALKGDDARLRDRYLLQAVRALFTLSRYEECIALWESEVSLLPEGNLMRQLIQPYVAGAEYRVNHSEKAITYFAQIGDVGSMLYCAGRSGEQLSTIDALELVCQYAPNSRYIPATLQSFVRSLEPFGEYYWEDIFVYDEEVERLYSLCLKMGKSRDCANPAMWYYTASMLEDLRGNESKASYLLGLAEQSKSSEFIKESVKVMRIYLDAKIQPYNSAYEGKLFAQLKWIDSKVEACIDDYVVAETACGYKLFNNESYYYWNDIMRRILLVEVCPRMIKAGKNTRALQLANMADNRLFGLVDKFELYDWVGDSYDYMVVESYTMSQYRYSDNFNMHDYSNSFFEMIDSLGVNTAIKYVQNVQNPKSDFDRYLNNRGYTGSDYLNDIVGTQCLRNMRYKDALTYLGKVSESYKKHHNVYMEYDPFSIEKRGIETKSDFRYDFAREMYSLEQGIEMTTEPNRRAQLLLQYATGVRNSFDLCWGLTQYYRGFNYWGQVCEKRDWENDEYTVAARQKAVELSQLACDIATDDETAANIHYALLNFKTVAKKYPNTIKGQLVRGQCDNLVDYQAMTLRSN